LLANIWNYDTKEYNDYILPEGSTFYDNDMDKKINCACCGKEIVYGGSYGSQEIHNDIGMSYMECEYCYFTKYNARKE